MDPIHSEIPRAATLEARHERWAHVHVNWTAVWVGALAAFSAALLIGLIGIALGAHLLGPDHRVVDLRKLGLGALIFSVCGAFFAMALGGWIAGKIAGILHSEPAMIHGAIVWAVTVPMFLAASAFGAGSYFGSWYAGLGGTPSWATDSTPFTRPEAPASNASSEDLLRYRTQLAQYDENVRRWHEDAPRVARNTAIGAATALLLGLAGCVVGGWMSSGEPMNFTHHLSRKPRYHEFA